MYTRLKYSHIRVEVASLACLELGIIQIIIVPGIHFWHVPSTRGTRIPRLLVVQNYLNNYFAMYTRLTLSRIRVELASPACLRLGVI